MIWDIFDTQLLASGIRLSTPLILAAFGGMFCERSGVTNIALDGIMIFGAFAGAVVAFETGNPWIGMLGAIITGSFIAHMHGVMSIRFQADQIVSATGINILALGIPALVANYLYGSTSVTPNIHLQIPEISIPFIADLPVLGTLIGKHYVIVYMTVLIVVASSYVLFRTSFGLRLRAVGEHPEAAESKGIDVYLVRYYGVWISGLLAGLGGAFLSIAHGSSYVRNISAGRGFIALSALIFGKYNPKLTVIGCLIFGIADALQIRLQSAVDIPVQFVQMFPYLLTMLILSGFIGKAYVPAAIGKPYEKNK